MNKYTKAAYNTVNVSNEPSFLEDAYEKEVQLDIWQYEKKKTMHALFSIGIILLIGNLIAFSSANSLDIETLT
jgi:hypothetical protein